MGSLFFGPCGCFFDPCPVAPHVVFLTPGAKIQAMPRIFAPSNSLELLGAPSSCFEIPSLRQMRPSLRKMRPDQADQAEPFAKRKAVGKHRRQRGSVRVEDPYQHTFEVLVKSYSSDARLQVLGFARLPDVLVLGRPTPPIAIAIALAIALAIAMAVAIAIAAAAAAAVGTCHFLCQGACPPHLVHVQSLPACIQLLLGWQ